LLAAINWRRLGDGGRSGLWIVFSATAFLALIGLAFLLPQTDLGGTLLLAYLLNLPVGFFLYLRQRPIYESLRLAGARRAPRLQEVALGLGTLGVYSVTLLFASTTVMQLPPGGQGAKPLAPYRAASIGSELEAPAGEVPGDPDLIQAIRAREVKEVRALLDGGADPNLATAEGETALAAAVRTGAPDVVRILLGAGADPDVRDHLGRTPLALARECAWSHDSLSSHRNGRTMPDSDFEIIIAILAAQSAGP
jgi:hypothetical protein